LDTLVEEKIMTEQGKQERFLSIIGVLASIAPLLGLLGTVTGMISTFRAITIFGTGDPRMMSTGISEALVTTQAGLGIAIPLLLAHHFLKRRVVFLVEDMEACGMGIIARLSKG
ncbi:MAG: MotA/TolQ/ExbB proton channel family protein, partial [Desulfobacteraceae bacterium]|nr:MotA/TolQ/ExbB proton channel family protein [Desulfobacteraceae bacterium]